MAKSNKKNANFELKKGKIFWYFYFDKILDYKGYLRYTY